jgi:ATP-binding cassette subfamily B protein
MTSQSNQLDDLYWPLSRLGDLLENLARRSKLVSHPLHLPQPPDSLFEAKHAAVARWISSAAGHLGLETESVDTEYLDIERFLRVGGPAILRIPGEFDQQRFIALLKGGRRTVRILTPELSVKKVNLTSIQSLLTSPYTAKLGSEIQELLSEAGIPDERQPRALDAILKEQLGALSLHTGWIVRLSPGADFPKQIRHGGVYRPIILLLSMYILLQLLTIASWLVIGRAVFQGHFDVGWLFAWAVLITATIPVQLIVNDAQSELSMNGGTIFKARLIHGTLKLEPEEIRHQGMGQFLSRVMESEAVEMLALSGGFMALLSFIELGLAVFILSKGAGGVIQALSLVIWVLITLIILWRYYKMSRVWTDTYRQMTDELVENMVGHRTRLAQQDSRFWHEEEDQALDRYFKISENIDSLGIQLNAVVTRGWIVIGLLGMALPFIANQTTPASMAIALGGVLLASQALAKLAGGAQSLLGLLIAWEQVDPLFKAASRPDEQPELDFVVYSPEGEVYQARPDPDTSYYHPIQEGGDQPLLTARDLVFRFQERGRPVLKEVSLIVRSGERLLLEGPSGGGKSTLAAVLTSLRKAESGSLLLWGYDRQILGGQEWRRRVVMAPQFQENHVFSETFAFNLLMGRNWPPRPGDLEQAEIICRELGLGDLLDRMPSGFQQMLGESGWQLSHGERSRLFIARTLLQQADMVILDESFGALDPENLQRSLECVLKRASTLMVIAHP